LAAMTRPSAAMSRTRSPRCTSAMRTRLLSKERLALDQACTAQPMAASRATAPRAGQR